MMSLPSILVFRRNNFSPPKKHWAGRAALRGVPTSDQTVQLGLSEVGNDLVQFITDLLRITTVYLFRISTGYLDTKIMGGCLVN